MMPPTESDNKVPRQSFIVVAEKLFYHVLETILKVNYVAG